jgi:leucyl/phenylalanyl-tRNA--protein transferase
VSDSFDVDFVSALCREGFLVMTAPFEDAGLLLLPKYHRLRSTLFFENLHIGRSVRPLLPKYELFFDRDYDKIVKNCIAMHGGDWLTPPLINALAGMRAEPYADSPRPVSFALYRNGVRVAGEFGVIAGGVYTSYSGYFIESSSGRVQMIKTALYLEQNGFAFWDLGMPLSYKETIGAANIDSAEWTRLFDAARHQARGSLEQVLKTAPA